MASSGEPMGEIMVGPVGKHSENMGGAGRGKSYDRIGPRDRAYLLAHDIRVGAGGNIHRDHRGGTRIQRRDSFGVKPAHWRTKAGAEDGIDQNIRVKDGAGRFSLQLFVRRNGDRATGSLVNISAASPRSSERSASNSTRTSLPAWCSLRAATNPSPPLFPFPQITPIRFAEG